MVRVVVIALLAAIPLSGCVTSDGAADRTAKSTVFTSYVTVEGAARMLAAKGVNAKWKTAEKICNEAGYATGTQAFFHCFADHQAVALRATRTRTKALTEDVARRYGLCIDRERFEIARCMEI